MMKTQRFDVHVCDPFAKHIQSEDCWCEPSRAYWMPGKDGKPLHVLEHNDTHSHEANTNWIVQMLDRIGKD